MALGSKKYWAFISYSHRDEAWAAWLHRSLERFSIPPALQNQFAIQGQALPKRLYPVFRDKDELPSSADLGERLNQALADARYLIVICSPNAARSEWVDAEIRYFKQLGGASRILPLIVAGEPYASEPNNRFDPDLECFPPALRYEVTPDGALTDIPTEPIAADVRQGKDNKEDALLRLAAGLLNTGYDSLKQREAKRRQRRLITALGASLAIMAIIVGQLFQVMAEKRHTELARQEAVREKNRAERATEEVVHEKNEVVRQRNRVDSLLQVATGALETIEAQKQDLEAVNQTLSTTLQSLKQEQQKTQDALQLAQAERDYAETQRVRAERERERAEIEKNRALRTQSELLYTQGLTALQKENTPEAIAALLRARELNPENRAIDYALLAEIRRNPPPLPSYEKKHTQPLLFKGSVGYAQDGTFHQITQNGISWRDAKTFEETSFTPFSGEGKVLLSLKSQDQQHIINWRAQSLATGASNVYWDIWDVQQQQFRYSISLPNIRAMDMQAVFKGQNVRANTLAYTVNDTLLQVAHLDNQTQSTTIHEAGFRAFSISPDEDKLAFIGKDSLVTLVSTETGALTQQIPYKQGYLNLIEFSDDGTELLAVDYTQKELVVWDTNDLTKPPYKISHPAKIQYYKTCPHRACLLFYTMDNQLHFWNSEKEAPYGSAVQIHRLGFLSFNHDGSLVAAHTLDGLTRFFSTVTGEEVYTPMATSVYATDIEWHPEGKAILTSNRQNEVQMWALRDQKPVPVIVEEGLGHLAFTEDGKQVWGQQANMSKVQGWDWATKKPVVPSFMLNEKTMQERILRMPYLSVMHADSSFSIVNLQTQKIQHFQDKIESLTSLWINESHQYLTYQEENQLQIWNLQNQAPVLEKVLDGRIISDYDLSEQNHRLAFYTIADSTLNIWDLQHEKRVGKPYKPAKFPFTLELSRQGDVLVWTDETAKGHLWDVENAVLKPSKIQTAFVSDIRFTPDGANMLFTSMVGGVSVFDVNGRLQYPPLTYKGGLIRFLPSANGEILYTLSSDDKVIVWDLRTGKMIGEPFSTPNAVNIALSPDQQTLAISDLKAGVFAIDLPPQDLALTDDLQMLIQYLGGKKMNDEALLEDLGNRTETLLSLRETFRRLPETDRWKVWTRWFWE